MCLFQRAFKIDPRFRENDNIVIPAYEGIHIPKKTNHCSSILKFLYIKTTLFGLCVLCMLGLTACGFKLRGKMNLPPQLHTLYLQTKTSYSEFTRQLSATLRFSDVNLADSPDKTPVILNISNESLTTSQINIASTQQLRNYTATFSVTYGIQDSRNRFVFGPKTIRNHQTITLLPNEMLTSSNK